MIVKYRFSMSTNPAYAIPSLKLVALMSQNRIVMPRREPFVGQPGRSIN